MKYSFAELNQNILTRNFGGTQVGISDPYLTGYHFIWFSKIPSKLIDYLSASGSGISDDSEVKNILAASCLSVTPPGGTLNTVEFTGLGGVKWGVPGNVDYGNTVSIKFLEFDQTPIYNIMHNWIKMIRDYRTGLTEMEDGDQGEGYTKKTYAGLLFYWTTSPDGKTIQEYSCFDGVYPTKDPRDLFTSDVETVGRLDLEIEFHLDYAWHEPWVKTKCQTLAQSFMAAKEIVKKYGESYSQ